ncbi:hypothetical protein SAMN02745831_07204 [Streptomyces sp. PgraA7]|nr:hypothetical protein SAMN02745831_07204 [Streptomyces sp. PgraA7]
MWSVFAGLAAVSLGLFFWERRLAAGAPDGGVRPVPLGRIAAGRHSMNPPTVPAPVRGREAELERIRGRVRGPGGGMAVVCGAGGLGKTTLAAEAAAQARADGRVVVWIRWRDDPERLGQDLAQAAHILGLPESRLEEARTGRVSLVDAVWEHLADVTGWLIVIDNVDTPTRVGPGSGPPAAYRGWLRPHGGGVLLVTSRDTTGQTWGPDADLIHLQPLADDAGAAVLLDAARHAGTAAEAEALAARLGGLPLGLNAAGIYLSVPTSRHRTFAAYQHALETEFADLLGAEHPAAATDPAVARIVVRHTWDLSLDQLGSDGYTLARPVLQLLALLEAAPVPRTLITPELVTDATGLPATAATVDAALAGLHQYGLLHTPGADAPEPASPAVSQLQLHPLVREVTAHTLARPEPTTAWLAALDEHLARAVAVVAGLPGRTGWPTARLLAPHLPAHLDRNTPHNLTTARNTLDTLADVLDAAGAVSEELLLRRHVLDNESTVLPRPPRHPQQPQQPRQHPEQPRRTPASRRPPPAEPHRHRTHPRTRPPRNPHQPQQPRHRAGAAGRGWASAVVAAAPPQVRAARPVSANAPGPARVADVVAPGSGAAGSVPRQRAGRSHARRRVSPVRCAARSGRVGWVAGCW